MAKSITAGVWISPDNNTWYKLTDDNRSPMQITPTRIEQVQRMADGTMRKFVVASKDIIDMSWTYIPSASSTLYTGGGTTGPFAPTTDGNYGAGFMKAFYDQYVFQPIYVRVVRGTDNYLGTAQSSSQAGTFTNPLTITTVSPGYSLSGGVPIASAGFVTYTTSTNHGLTIGQIVDIAGITPVGYNGTYVVTAVTSTKFTISNINTASASGSYMTALPMTGTDLYQAFITDFKYTVVKRLTLTDYVDVTLQFTEI
jgi:hypothetical protein